MSESEIVEEIINGTSRPSRKRSANFTPNETMLLLSLISENKNIIENKKTDGVSIQEKNRAWKKITEAFNCVCPESRHRTTESLKKLYDNKKREIRKVKAEEKKEILLTSGGVPKQTSKYPGHDLILSIVDLLTVVGGTSYYGSDSMLPSNIKPNDDNFTFELENPDEGVTNINSDINKNQLRKEQEKEPDACDNGEGNKDSLSYTGWKKGADLLRPKSSLLKRPREETLAITKDIPSVTHNVSKIKDINKNITNNTSCRPLNRRRPTETVVRSLASNQLAENYKQLADKESIIADFTLKKLKLDIQHSNEEHDLKIQALKLDIDIKKQQLQYSSH